MWSRRIWSNIATLTSSSGGKLGASQAGGEEKTRDIHWAPSPGLVARRDVCRDRSKLPVPSCCVRRSQDGLSRRRSWTLAWPAGGARRATYVNPIPAMMQDRTLSHIARPAQTPGHSAGPAGWGQSGLHRLRAGTHNTLKQPRRLGEPPPPTFYPSTGGKLSGLPDLHSKFAFHKGQDCSRSSDHIFCSPPARDRRTILHLLLGALFGHQSTSATVPTTAMTPCCLEFTGRGYSSPPPGQWFFLHFRGNRWGRFSPKPVTAALAACRACVSATLHRKVGFGGVSEGRTDLWSGEVSPFLRLAVRLARRVPPPSLWWD